MPLNSLPPRACRSNPIKYSFSDSESDDDTYSPLGSPEVTTESPSSHSASPSSPSSPYTLPPPCKSHSRKRSPSHIRRPRNAFIIFRSEFCFKQKASDQNIETDHRQISRIAAYIWRDLAEEKKAEYKRRAEEEKAAHKAAYPDYRYAPIGRPRATVRQKSKRNNNEEIYRCRAAAEMYLSGLQEKQSDGSSATMSLDEKSTSDSVLADPDTSSSERVARRRLPSKKRKERSCVAPSEEEKKYTVVEVSNNQILDHPQSPLNSSPILEPILDPTPKREVIEPKPVDFMQDTTFQSKSDPTLSPHLQGSIYQDSMTPPPLDRSDDFSKLTLYQLVKAREDNSQFINPISTINSFDGDGDGDGDRDRDYNNSYPDSETCFSTPTELLFPESGSNGATLFETRLADREIVDSAFRDNDILTYSKSFEFEEYLDL